jgi:hypothetical protein
VVLGAFACAGRANSVLQDLQSLRQLEDGGGPCKGLLTRCGKLPIVVSPLQGYIRTERASEGSGHVGAAPYSGV